MSMRYDRFAVAVAMKDGKIIEQEFGLDDEASVSFSGRGGLFRSMDTLKDFQNQLLAAFQAEWADVSVKELLRDLGRPDTIRVVTRAMEGYDAKDIAAVMLLIDEDDFSTRTYKWKKYDLQPYRVTRGETLAKRADESSFRCIPTVHDLIHETLLPEPALPVASGESSCAEAGGADAETRGENWEKDGGKVENSVLTTCVEAQPVMHFRPAKTIDLRTLRREEELKELIFSEGTESVAGDFSGCENLRHIVFPQSLRKIGTCAFMRCEALSELVFPGGLREIGDGAFYGCTSLRTVDIPADAVCGAAAFSGCRALADEDGFVVVNGTLFDVAEDFNDRCRRDENGEMIISIPPEVTAINGDGMFNTIDSFGEKIGLFTVTDTIAHINAEDFNVWGIGLFRVTDHITGQTIVETDAFEQVLSTVNSSERFEEFCELLCEKDYDELNREFASIGDELPPEEEYDEWEDEDDETITINKRGEITAVDDHGRTPRTYSFDEEKLRSGLFQSCRNTAEIELGLWVKLEKKALAGCVSLKRLDMSGREDNGEVDASLCEGCTALETVILPTYAYYIGERAFAGCKKLRDIQIPDSVFCIHPTAFEGCDALPEETRRVIASLTSEKSLEEWESETLAYVQSHGAAGFKEKYMAEERECDYPRWIGKNEKKVAYRTELARVKRLCDVWWSVYGEWLDWPETLLSWAAYGVYAEKGVEIEPPRPQWQMQKTIGKKMRYMIVDAEKIPDLYRLEAEHILGLEPRRPYSSRLDKAIELKKQGSGIQILTKAHFEKLVAAGAFVAPRLERPTPQEPTVGKWEQRREEQDEAFELVIQDVKEWCETSGEKLTTVGQMSRFAAARGIKMEKCREIMRSRAATAVEYLVQLGVYETPKMRFTSTVDALAAKYSGEKAKTIRQLEEENPEMDISALQNSVRKYAKCTAREYLIQRGILYSDDELTALSGAQSEPKPETEISDELREKMERTFAKLDEYYPDKVVSRLHNDHRELGKKVTELYRALGYTSGREFLTAYGYHIEASVGGAPRGDHMAIIEELKRRYADGARCETVLDLRRENPDLAPKFKNLSNQATELFGMPFAMYLRKIGVLTGWDKRSDARRDEALAEQKRQEEELAEQKQREAAARELELARRKTQLQTQLDALRKERDAIKGLFAKARKAKLEPQIAEIEAELVSLEEELNTLRAMDS